MNQDYKNLLQIEIDQSLPEKNVTILHASMQKETERKRTR